jgi:hypothetical protein
MRSSSVAFEAEKKSNPILTIACVAAAYALTGLVGVQFASSFVAHLKSPLIGVKSIFIDNSEIIWILPMSL